MDKDYTQKSKNDENEIINQVSVEFEENSIEQNIITNYEERLNLINNKQLIFYLSLIIFSFLLLSFWNY